MMIHPVQGASKAILVVDDVPANLKAMKNILMPYYRVQVATDGRSAIKIAMSSARPDIILLDVMMPEMDGYEVIRILQQEELTRTIPIIFVTAKSDVEDEAKGFELGGGGLSGQTRESSGCFGAVSGPFGVIFCVMHSNP